MKILMTLMSLDIGGAETHVTELAKQLVREGHKLVIVAKTGVYAKELEEAGIKIYNAPLHKRSFVCMKESYKILKQAIILEKPDIVHAHARIPAFICSLIRKTVKFSFVTSAHGTYVTGFGLKLLSDWGDATLAVSEDIKKYLLKNYKLDKSDIIVSVNGVDTDKFSIDNHYGDVASELGFNPEAKRIVYTSRLIADVCLPLFRILEIFESLNEKCPGLELLVIGDGDIFDEINAKASQINTNLQRKAIVLTGGTTNVSRYISTADLCIGVGRAILESMAMKKPAIVAGAEGYIGVFEESKYDVCVETNFTCRGQLEINNMIFEEDILRVLSMTKEEVAALGDYGRRTVLSKYSISKMTEDNMLLYKMGLAKTKCDIAILGYYGFRNSGDDALLQAMISSLRKIRPDITINVFSSNPRETKRHYDVETTYRYNIFKVIKTIKQCRLFVLGGGSLIQDGTSTKSLLFYLWFVKTAKKCGKKVMLYANGIGPVFKKFNRKRAAKVLNRVDLITLREDDSITELNKMGVGVPRILLTADPAFAVEETNEFTAREILREAGIEEDKPYACISVRKWKNAPENFDELCAGMADYIAGKYNVIPVFIPMQYPYDAAIGRKIVTTMKKKGVFISRRIDFPTMLALVEKSEMVISVRLHMLIYATMKSVPCIGIAYDPKVSSFQRYLGQPYCIDPRALEGGDYKAMIDECMEHAEEIRQELSAKGVELREKAEETARMAINLMEDKNENSLH
ncbi:MAG: polysaccharide pyruvyl transferase CsaB [Clostridia bacterium]|nr:polysaccharide pyruvyl transferase CsaB [Clostridia bacterium]